MRHQADRVSRSRREVCPEVGAERASPHRLNTYLGGAQCRSNPGGWMMTKRIVDLSVTLKSGIASDPPGFLPHLDYIDHNAGASQLAF